MPHKLVRSARMDRKITLQRKTVSQNSLGEEVETWADLATVWAEKSYRAAGESVQAAEVAAVRILRFVIRWDSAWADFSPIDRLTLDGVICDVVEVNEIGRRDGLEIFAKARAE
jgi:SPP1 family predicted phage head-tail adaptor